MHTDHPTRAPGTLDKPPVPARNVVGVIGRTLNLVDARLVNHGRRVAELVCRALVKRGGCTPRQLLDLCLLAHIHDIGAFKTDEIDRLIHFESVRVWQHAIYGYLFVRNIQALSPLAPVVLFHHAGRQKLRHVHKSFHELSQIFHIADRLDILGLSHGRMDKDTFASGFNRGHSIKFLEPVIDLFDAALFDPNQPDPSLLYRDKPEFTVCDGIFAEAAFSEEEIISYLNMLVHSIDFRSPQTVTHTVGVAAIADLMAGWLGFNAETKRKIHFGAMIHDLGKQGIPPEILEAKRKLTSEEFDVMRSHVRLSEEVLTGYVNQNIINIAVRHHERLNGRGYHHGLSAADLTLPERLVAVADILSALLGVRSYKDSFPKEQVEAILTSMSKEKHLDPDVVNAARAGLDEIVAVMERVSLETRETYETMQEEYVQLLNLLDESNGESSFVLDAELPWKF